MGDMLHFCEAGGIKLSTAVPYHPASNDVAKHAIGVLTNAICMVLSNSGLPKSLWAEAYNMVTYV